MGINSEEGVPAMSFVAISRTSFSLGALIALLVLIAAFVFLIVGGASTFALVIMIGALALAVLVG